MIYLPLYCSCSWMGAALSHNALAGGCSTVEALFDRRIVG